jgi:phage terminase small subunit
MKGRKPIPTKLKVLAGNPGKRKSDIDHNEPIPPPGDPEMPAWLRSFPVAVEEWIRESEILSAMGLLSVADSGTFAMRCYLASQIQETADKMNIAEGDKSYSQIKQLITEYRNIGSLLGLDPASRTKLSVDPSRKSKSKFDGLVSIK